MNKIIQDWLTTLCTNLQETKAAVFFSAGNSDEQPSPLATWPSNLTSHSAFSHIATSAQQPSNATFSTLVSQDDGRAYDFFAYPVAVQQGISGVVAFQFERLPPERQQAVADFLSKSEKTLAIAVLKQQQPDDFYAAIVSLLVTCYEQKTYPNALIRLATVLTRTLSCERVAIGEFQRYHSKVVAISNSAQFDDRANLMQIIADAMDEAIEQDKAITFPNPQTATVQRAHEALARKFGTGAILTLPMVVDGNVFGAITLLRGAGNPFDAKTKRFCEQAIALLTPVLALKKADEEPLLKKIAKVLSCQIKQFFGIKYLKLKLIFTGLAAAIAASALLQGDFRVTADAILEGKTQRAVTAPITGYVLSASVRAGDTVRKGDIMAQLDDAELKLELSKLSGQLQKYRREYREALSLNDLVKVRVINAQTDQASAALDLAKQQLQQIALKAPYDGFVIEGDLSQLLGSPIERGETLFKIAPLEGYRIILKVSERLISYVKPGQKGTLALASMPESRLNLTVQKITAVAKTEDGENIFRVEANLDHAPALLRPGMEGIGKINAGEASFLWIWTHELTDWLRLWLWSWWR